MRLIDADALKDFYGRWSNNHTEFLKPEVDHFIDAQPTINPDDLRSKGRWVLATVEDDDQMTPIITGHWCNMCWKPGDGASNYCPNCGAKMDGKENEDA